MERPSRVITIDTICFDTVDRAVSQYNKMFSMTSIEGRVLHFLAMNVNNICTESQIIAHVFGSGFINDQGIRLLKRYIRYVRYKIEPDPNNPTYIVTIPQIGYKLVIPDGSKNT